MENFYGICLLYLLYLQSAAGQCNFTDSLLGVWTTSNLGTFTFGTDGGFNTTATIIGGTAGLSMTCHLAEGDVYVIRSNDVYQVFSGVSTIYVYMCLDLRSSTDHAYYYYLNSPTEKGFSYLRLVGLASATDVTTMSQICSSTLDVAEFHTMVREGHASNAIKQCPDRLLGNFWYTYTDSASTACDNTTLLDVCNQNLTSLLFDTTGADATCAAKKPMYSTYGNVGCVVGFSETDSTTETTTDYVSVYNFDTTVDGSTTYRFTCFVMTSDDNDRVLLSLNPSSCEAGQTSTNRPTNGALMELTPFSVCPVTTSTTEATTTTADSTTTTTTAATTTTAVSSERDNTGLIVGFGVSIIVLILIVAAGDIGYKCFIQKNSKITPVEKNMEPTYEVPGRELSGVDVDFHVEKSVVIFDKEMASIISHPKRNEQVD